MADIHKNEFWALPCLLRQTLTFSPSTWWRHRCNSELAFHFWLLSFPIRSNNTGTSSTFPTGKHLTAVQLSSVALQDQHSHRILRSTTHSVCPKHTHSDDKRGSCMQTVAVSMSLQRQHPSVTDLTGAPRYSSTENPGGKSDVTRAGCSSPTKVSKSLKSHVTALSM